VTDDPLTVKFLKCSSYLAQNTAMRWLTVVLLLVFLSACNSQDKGSKTGTKNLKKMTNQFKAHEWGTVTTNH